jgi:hypothetical protein
MINFYFLNNMHDQTYQKNNVINSNYIDKTH